MKKQIIYKKLETTRQREALTVREGATHRVVRPAVVERITFAVELDWEALFAQAGHAVRNKRWKSKDGALTVEVLKVETQA